MHQHHKVTVGISPKREILDSLCSCTECDSVGCFAKRQVHEPCACKNCRNSKSCLFYNSKTNLSVSKSDLNYKDIEISTESITKELFKKKIIYEFDKNMTTFTRKQSNHSYKTDDSKYETEKDNDLHKIRANSSRKEANLSTAKLSAEIMDVPYKDFKKTVFIPNFSSNMNKTSPFNIINRIKEAYKACSCKVCECIVGKSLQNDLCRCEPCECDDCANFNRHMQSFTGSVRLVPKYDEVCSNIGCDDCKGIGKRKNEAQNSCDCLGLHKSEYRKGGDSLTQPCDCEPCQCIECKSRSIYSHKTLIVAPVEEDQQQRNECLCSPCECFQCGQTNGLMANLNHEMTTSITRHPHCHCEMCLNEACLPDGNQSCRCERQSKVISKPVQQDSHDYDIRRTTISYDDAQKHSGKCDTIAMFTAITNLYEQQEQHNKCDCDICECLVCKYSTNTSLSSKMVEPLLKCKPRDEVNDCKYSPCESQFCVKHHPNLPNLKRIYVCSCDVCDCMNCEDIERTNGEIENEDIKKPISTFSAREYCKCDKSEKLMNTCVGNISQCSNMKCDNCIKKNNFDEVIYPVRKGEQLTPSIFRKKMKDTLHKEKILKQPIAIKSSLKKPSALSSVQETITRDYNVGASYQECFQDSHIDCQMFPSKIMTRNEFTGKHAQISKCANGINMRCRNFEPALESNLYVTSSLSFLKETGSITPSKSRLKFWESSCNRSVHDYPSYSIHFPKTTVETCLNDVMQFDNDNNIKLTTVSLSSKNISQKQHDPDLSLPNYSKYQPVKTVLPVEKPTVKYNGGTNIEKNDNFKYFGQNYENNPYRPQNLETTPNVSKPIHNTTNLMRSSFPKRYETYTTSGNKKKNLVNFALQEDCERLQNTLQEAREFSLQLVQLLKKYEKANSEFESVSKRLKISNDPILNQINTSKYPNTDEDTKYSIDIDDELTMEDSLKVSSGSSTEELMEINKNANKMKIANFTNDHSFVDEANNIVSENISMSGTCDDNNEGRDESGDDIIKKNNKLLTLITEEKEPIDKHIVRKKKVAKIPHKKYNKLYKHYLICSKRTKGFTNKSSAEIYTATETNCNTILQNNKTIEETHMFDKCIKEDFNTEVKLPKVAQGVNFKNSATGEFELRVPETEKHSKDRHIMQKDVGLIKQPMVKVSHTHKQNFVVLVPL